MTNIPGTQASDGVPTYPDAAHGFLLQHHAEFAPDVVAFLTAPKQHQPRATHSLERRSS